MFKKKDGAGQESLFNVMKAYSIHDREVGYCQGSAFIVGLLLMEVSGRTSELVIFPNSVHERTQSDLTVNLYDGKRLISFKLHSSQYNLAHCVLTKSAIKPHIKSCGI